MSPTEVAATLLITLPHTLARKSKSETEATGKEGWTPNPTRSRANQARLETHRSRRRRSSLKFRGDARHRNPSHASSQIAGFFGGKKLDRQLYYRIATGEPPHPLPVNEYKVVSVDKQLRIRTVHTCMALKGSALWSHSTLLTQLMLDSSLLLPRVLWAAMTDCAQGFFSFYIVITAQIKMASSGCHAGRDLHHG